jgi:hypothetical protein
MTNHTFAALDLAQLSTITGGASTAAESKLVLDKLNARFGSEGVVSFIGKPQFISTGRRGIDTVSGKFDTNALEGGDTQRSFTGLVDTSHRKVSNLHTHIIGAE